MDMRVMADDGTEKKKWSAITACLTPVAKAYGSDMSFRVTESAIQVYGGYGYMKDYPVEQFLRDEKVHSIFEGTNGIQSLDLAGRKLLRDGNILFDTLFKDIKEFCRENINNSFLGGYIKILDTGIDALADVTEYFTSLSPKDFDIIALYAAHYTELFGDVIVGWLLLWQAVIATEKLEKMIEKKGIKDESGLNRFISGNSDAAFYSGKQASARYFLSTVLSQAGSKANVIKNGDKAAIEIAEESF
jgi:hypothetical protein